MPQDLAYSLVASPESQTPQTPRLDDVSQGSTATGHDGYNEFTIHRQEGKRINAQQLRTNRAKVSERNDLHPYVQTLSLSNLESCVALENAVFSEEERCSREKVDLTTSFDSYLFLSRTLCLCFFLRSIDLASPPSDSSTNVLSTTTRTFLPHCLLSRVAFPEKP